MLRTIYNGTDTEKFKRTPEMAVEAKKRYPIEDRCDESKIILHPWIWSDVSFGDVKQ